MMSETNPPIPYDIDRHSKILWQFEKETDRGLAIVAMAIIDEQIRDAIRIGLRQDVAQLNKILPENKAGNMGEWLTRLAYCLGLFGKTTLCNIQKMRSIRNDFAHSPTRGRAGELLTFNDPDIAEKCRSLDLIMHVEFGRKEWWESQREEAKDPKRRFIITASFITQLLNAAIYTQGIGSPRFWIDSRIGLP